MIEFTYQTHKTGPYREVFREFESSKGLPKVHRPRETSERAIRDWRLAMAFRTGVFQSHCPTSSLPAN